jgi:siderophore synthetase component
VGLAVDTSVTRSRLEVFMTTIRRISNALSATAYRLLQTLASVVRAHQQQMVANAAYRAGVLNLLENAFTAFAGRYAALCISLVRLYGTV